MFFLQVDRVEVESLRAVGLRNKMAAMHEVTCHDSKAHMAWLMDGTAGSSLLRQTCSLGQLQTSQAAGLLQGMKEYLRLLLSRLSFVCCVDRQERRQKQQELQQLLKEKQQELDRCAQCCRG
jgi:hypothetical protein